MAQIAIGIFMALHGLVHLLYLGQSARLFELKPGMIWPDGSWAFSKLLGDGGTRVLASISCTAAAIGFAAGGIGIFAAQAWWRPVVVMAAVLSSALYILFWDGGTQKPADKGGIALLINLVILAALLVLHWPSQSF
ncbi:MAG: hypothetical protein JXB23_04720 [Candidatus Aminicenantes bacterium]|nr:hypothetical protein [Candidatus Aminicenantes bacterium]